MKLSSKIKTAAMALVLAVAGAGATLAPVYAACDCTTQQGCTRKEIAQCGMDVVADKDASGQITNPNLEDTVKNIINAVLYIVGILAVVMVIIGGVQYTTSGGDQAAVTKAKNTILYGIVGLVIAILAYAIVNFVIGKLS